ncbi:hypothetical protein BVX93_00250 [bacterium B13(2017)]|nr:hypothetical protein BVX93_00250 [bacterium B13(2017)]
MKKIILFLLLHSLFITLQPKIYPQSVTNPSSFGEEEDGLESLFFLEIPNVITSTLIKQKLTLAPSVMTVLAEKDIIASGTKTLGELLFYITNIDICNGKITDVILSIRGIRNINNNSKILFLVDGSKMNNLDEGNWLAWGLAGIKQIEIIRGPGSAIYGDHAFAGVINLITKKADEINNLEINLGGGSYDTYIGSVVFGKEFNDDLNFRIIYDYFDTDGPDDNIVDYDDFTFFNYSIPTNISNAPGPVWEGKYFQICDTKIEYKNNYFKFRFEDTKYELFMGNLGLLTSTPSYDSETKYFYEAGSQIIKDNYSFDFKLWYIDNFIKQEYYKYPDNWTFPFDINNDGLVEYFPFGGLSIRQGNSLTYGAKLNYQINFLNIHEFLLGIFYEDSKTKNLSIKDTSYRGGSTYGQLTESYSPSILKSVEDTMTREFYGIFIQDIISLNVNFNLILGCRLDEYEKFGSTFNPRLAFIWNKNHSFIKILYGSAFRAPTIVEVAESANVIYSASSYGISLDELSPEKNKTYELNLGTTLFDTLKLELSFFYNKITDLIDTRTLLIPIPDFEEVYYIQFLDNIGSQEIYGIELNIEYLITQNTNTYLKYAYLETEDEITNAEIPTQPKNKIHVGLQSLFFNNNSIFNIDVFHSSKRPRSINDSRFYTNDYAEAFTIVNTSFTYKNLFIENFDVVLSINNVFNEKYERQNISELPVAQDNDDFERTGRTLNIKGKIKI